MEFRRVGEVRSLPEIPLATIYGAGLLGTVTFAYMMMTRMSLVDGIVPEGLLEVLVLGVPALGLLYAGFWLSTGDFTPAQIWEIGFYAISAVGIAALGVSLVFLFVPLSGLGLREAFFLYISTGTEGAFFGVLLGVVHVTNLLSQDISDHKKRQEQQVREKERLESVVSTASHDLRNPLSVAQGRLMLAEDEVHSEHHEEIEQAHDRMETLIEELLVFARRGETGVELEPVDLDEVMEACWVNVPTEDATIISLVERDITADRSRIQHLLENLFRNAVEHGGDEVTVTVGEFVDGFYVEDDGPGIPEAERDEVFKAGYSTREEGTGFGLSIVNEIVVAHEWEIRVTEGSNGGARFEITGVEFVSG